MDEDTPDIVWFVEVKTPKGWEQMGGEFDSLAPALALYCVLSIQEGTRLTSQPKE